MSYVLRFCILMLWVLLCNAAHRTCAASVLEATRYNGFDAYRLSDGKTEAVVVPALSGRIMRYGFVGGPNWLWNAPEEKLQADGYKNYGGDKTFAGPHAAWNSFASNIWPPDPTWDGAAHTATKLPDGHLQTTGNLWRGFGVRVVRTFSFAPSGELLVAQRLEKLHGEPRLLSIWQVAQITPPDAVFLRLSPQSAYKNGFHAFGALPPTAQAEAVSSSLLQIKPTTGRGYKLGADSPVSAIAAVKGGVALVLRAVKVKGSYPDGAEGAGFPVEFYNHGETGAGQYNEIELLSPLRLFTKGTGWSYTVRWSLHTLPGKDVDATEIQSDVEKLLRQP